MSAHGWIACHDCDLLHRLPPLGLGQTAHCRRCGAVLHRHRRDSLDRTLAFAMAGLILFALANTLPFLAFKLDANVQQTTLITGVQELYAQGWWALALLVFITSVLAPLLYLSGLLYLLLPLKFTRLAWGSTKVMRALDALKAWSMMEVFMLGILVSVVKLAKMAKIVPGIALFAFLALIFVLAAAMSSLDPHLVWDKLESE